MVAPKKLAFCGLGSFVGGILIGWVIFPPTIKSQIRKGTRLKKGGDRRPFWEKIPFGFDFKMYLFNISNPEGIERGEKPIVQEVGPYFYEEWKEKVNVVDIDKDDSIEFNTKTTYIFRPDMSNGLTGDEELILPHILILSMILTVIKDKPKLTPMVGKALDSIFKKPSSLFMPIKPKDLFFEGLPIDCSNVKDVPGKGVCAILKEQADAGALQQSGEMQFKFSLFGARNNTPSKQKWHARRGIENIVDVGMMMEYDGKPAMETWDGSYCNAINGTDGTVFAPFLDPKVPIRSFSADLCRVVDIKYSHPTKVEGIKVGRYTSDLGDIPNTPEMQCFCTTPDNCLKKGALDLSKCMGAPIIATLPHFYLTDESYLQSVVGLHPDKEKHQIFLDFELFTATPIEARSRMQFNALIQPVEKIKLMAKFPEAMLPLFWVEEGILVPKFVRSQIKMLRRMMKFVWYLKWLMVLGGIGMLGTGLGLYYNQNAKSDKVEVKKVTSQFSRESTAEEKKWPPDFQEPQANAVPPNLDGYY